MYIEIEDQGQNVRSLRLVITDKIRNGKDVIKAELVACGFEEDRLNLLKDSPTCSKEAVCFMLSLTLSNEYVCHTGCQGCIITR